MSSTVVIGDCQFSLAHGIQKVIDQEKTWLKIHQNRFDFKTGIWSKVILQIRKERQFRWYTWPSLNGPDKIV